MSYSSKHSELGSQKVWVQIPGLLINHCHLKQSFILSLRFFSSLIGMVYENGISEPEDQMAL